MFLRGFGWFFEFLWKHGDKLLSFGVFGGGSGYFVGYSVAVFRFGFLQDQALFSGALTDANGWAMVLYIRGC